MKKTIEKIFYYLKTKKMIHYIFIIIVGLLISIPFLWVQIRTTDDGWLHLLRVIGIDNALEKGSFPFLIQPYFCNNWGYSMTAFYPTIVSYVPYVLGLIVSNFAVGLKWFAVLTTILSGIFMYNFINEVTKKKAVAFFSAIIYMTFPYKLEDIFNRYAIGEFTAFVFIPIVFEGLYNLLHGDGKKHFYIAIGGTGLLLSHTISTEYTAIFCAIYILFNLKLFFKKDVIIKCVINVIWILLMAAIFWVPMLEFEGTAHYSIFEPKVIKTDGEYVANNVIELWQFVKDKGEPNGVSFIVGIPFITMLLLGVFAYKKVSEKHKDFYITFVLLGVLSVLMCTKFFPWRIMPSFLCTVQYPWRMVGFAFFFFIPVCAMNVCYLIKNVNKQWLRNALYILTLVLILGFTAYELTQYKTADPNVDAEYEKNAVENPKIHYFAVNRDYMPLKALVKQRSYLVNRGDKTLVLQGNANIQNESKDAFHLEMNITDAEKNTKLELPYLFYPGYRAVLEYGQNTVNLKTEESDNGFVQITIPEQIEEGKITVDYTATVLDKASYIVSGISLVCFIVYVIYSKKKNDAKENAK